MKEDVKIIENEWITMLDGCRLSAKIWLPESAHEHTAPAVLEYIPYRKRDFKAIRDAELYHHFAANGYAGVRVDLRGSGDSEGILRDEYLQQELNDGIEILKWISAQPWCDGNIGMMGISWGGFNALQIAALQPPELKAIITVASSDNRYADDVHYMGGNLLTDNLSWASTMYAYNSCPPDPEIAGNNWKALWLERLEGSGLWLKKWLEHQRLDDYWKHASVGENYSAIQCPVYAFGGWADGYSNSVFRLIENLKVPGKGLIGPWGHKYPHLGGPGPIIDFIGECIKWWDRWLKGIKNGIDEEPKLRVWMQDTVSPISSKRPGEWIEEKSWPTSNVQSVDYQLQPGFILFHEHENHNDVHELTIQSPLSVGLFAGKWCSYAESTDLPSDQREEDGGALVFDSPVLEADLEILGAPELILNMVSNKPIATIAVRISDVAPNGRATRVTYGLLNLTHRESDENPLELEPGKAYKVRIKLNHIAQKFPAGNQIRLSISTSYWPLAWPPPEPARITIFPEECTLTLPVRKASGYGNIREMDTPEGKEFLSTTLLVPAKREWKVIHNLASNEVVLNVINNDAKYKINDINWIIQKDVSEKYSYKNNNYDTLRGEVVSIRSFKRDGWEASTVTRTVLTSTKTHFIIRATLDAYEGDNRIFSKTWDERIVRDML